MACKRKANGTLIKNVHWLKGINTSAPHLGVLNEISNVKRLTDYICVCKVIKKYTKKSPLENQSNGDLHEVIRKRLKVVITFTHPTCYKRISMRRVWY